jgi:hypothetical protein
MAKKIPIPKTKKSGSSFPWTRLQLGLASILNRNPLTLGRIPGANTASYGSKAWRAQQLANMAKMGKWSGRAAKLGRLGVMNPWFMAPAALAGLAKYSVGKTFDPYRDETGKIGAAGHERLLQERLAREELMFARNAARGQENVTGMFYEGGIARLL